MSDENFLGMFVDVQQKLNIWKSSQDPYRHQKQVQYLKNILLFFLIIYLQKDVIVSLLTASEFHNAK